VKTVEEKAQLFIDAAEHYSVNFGEWREESRQALIKLLKEQDRDARHNCAEAVIQCEEDVSGECTWKNDAYSACMNAVGV
jgi:putative IMPACT (imprinted ancient) family translation regulator